MLPDDCAVLHQLADEAAEKANEIPAPVKIPDPAAEPTVTILWSESDKLQDGEIMPLSVANRVFEELDTAQHTDREKDGYEGGWYDKTAFRIDFTLNGQPDNYEGRQDFGDGEGFLIQHIQSYHEYYAKDENWKNFVLHNKGPEAWEQDKAEREMVLTEFIPYLKQHCNLSAMEQTATTALREGQNISPEQAAYYNTVVWYIKGNWVSNTAAHRGAIQASCYPMTSKTNCTTMVFKKCCITTRTTTTKSELFSDRRRVRIFCIPWKTERIPCFHRKTS